MPVDICYPDGTDWSCLGTEEELAALDPAIQERSEALAWTTLASLTGFRVALCPSVIRPCLAKCSTQTWYTAPVGSDAAFGPYLSNGKWYNGCGCKTSDCSCVDLCEVIMPSEVGGIVEVTLDGATLDPTAYRVDNGNRLVRTDGGCWPSCQDMAAPTTEVGTFAVSYYGGIAPNDLLRYAAGVLAAEFYKACSGKDCRLPSGVTSIVRSGISMQVQSSLFIDGTSGIPEVDAVIHTYNPHGLRSRPRVMSPDSNRARMTTWG